MPTPPIRATLLVPLLSLALLVSGPGASPTRADTPPAPCGLADVAEPAATTDETLVLLHAILADDPDEVLADQRPRPDGPAAPNTPTTPNVPPPPGAVTAPRPPGTDLRPPNPALLNAGPIVAARQLRESLSEQQLADLQAVMTKHQDALRQARAGLPEPPGALRPDRASTADRGASLAQASTELQRIGDQVDTEIDAILTPSQRALLERAKPKRLGSELPVPPADLTAGMQADC